MSQKYIGGFITKNPTAPSGPYETSVATGMWTLDQAMQFKKQGLWPTAGNIAPLVIGQAYGGGYYAGQIGVSGVATHNLVVGPVASAQASKAWKNAATATTGADSVIDGPQNTADMVAHGSSTVYVAAHFCNDLVIGGFTDWYMPAKNELEVCYYNLKPTTASNGTTYGINANAVPARASNYTAGTPAQTSAADFKDTGAEDFNVAYYWTSTETGTLYAARQYFGIGIQSNTGYKPSGYFVRAIRRVAV
jgi:hypothetical protein